MPAKAYCGRVEGRGANRSHSFNVAMKRVSTLGIESLTRPLINIALAILFFAAQHMVDWRFLCPALCELPFWKKTANAR